MAAWLELHLKGGGCALIEAGSICGLIATGYDLGKPGSAEKPTRVVIRGGETLDVIGESPIKILARASEARKLHRSTPEQETLVDWLAPLGEGLEDESAGP